jgi:hypothetical protein
MTWKCPHCKRWIKEEPIGKTCSACKQQREDEARHDNPAEVATIVPDMRRVRSSDDPGGAV